MLTYLKNTFWNISRYKEHPQAVIVACYFNPQHSDYRRKAFDRFYQSIKHLNHRIVECVIGVDKPQLPASEFIECVYTPNLLWHKESLLNLAVSKLQKQFKYVFWLDTDIEFTNKNWLPESVAELKAGAAILQPFEYCYHLEKDETEPGLYPKIWRSFCANFVDKPLSASSSDYNTHGHVGFAWGAHRDLLIDSPLYDKALIGGADHIIAHAAAGQIPSPCIDKSFTEDLEAVYKWSILFSILVNRKIAYTQGNLYHYWHGDIEKRQYLKRIQEFTPETKQITEKDGNGLYVTKKPDSQYIKSYFDHREVRSSGVSSRPSLPVIRVNPSPSVHVTHHNHYHDNTPVVISHNITEKDYRHAPETFS